MFCLCSHTLHARTLCAYDFTKVAIFRNKNNFLQKKIATPLGIATIFAESGPYFTISNACFSLPTKRAR